MIQILIIKNNCVLKQKILSRRTHEFTGRNYGVRKFFQPENDAQMIAEKKSNAVKALYVASRDLIEYQL